MHLIKLQIITEPWLQQVTLTGVLPVKDTRLILSSLAINVLKSSQYYIQFHFLFLACCLNKYKYIVTTGNNLQCNIFFWPIRIIINKGIKHKAFICVLSIIKCQWMLVKVGKCSIEGLKYRVISLPNVCPSLDKRTNCWGNIVGL